MHVGSLGGTWGVPPDTLGHAKGLGWISDRFGVILGSLFGALWGPSEAQFAPSKPASRPKETKKWT